MERTQRRRAAFVEHQQRRAKNRFVGFKTNCIITAKSGDFAERIFFYFTDFGR